MSSCPSASASSIAARLRKPPVTITGIVATARMVRA